jgi:hypothetical protein
VTANVTWQELYRTALLELRPEELRLRIDIAEKAIQQRLAELRGTDSNSEEDLRARDDALRGLRILASTECKAPQSTPQGCVRSEVRS